MHLGSFFIKEVSPAVVPASRQLFLATQHQYVSENVIKIWGNFGAIFLKKPWANIVQGLWPDFGATLKIRKKSKCEESAQT